MNASINNFVDILLILINIFRKMTQIQKIDLIMKTIQKIKNLSIVHRYETILSIANQLLRVKNRVKLSTIYVLNFVKNNDYFDLCSDEYQKAFEKIKKIALNFVKFRNQRQKIANTLKRKWKNEIADKIEQNTTIFDSTLKKMNKACDMIENKKLTLQRLVYIMIDRLFDENNIRQREKIKKMMSKDWVMMREMKEKKEQIFYLRLLLLKMHYDEIEFLMKEFSFSFSFTAWKFDKLLHFRNQLKRVSMMLTTVVYFDKMKS